MEEDGNSSEDSLETNSDKNQDRSKSTEKSRLDGAGASAPPSQQAVVDVDRESGNQHWGEIMNGDYFTANSSRRRFLPAPQLGDCHSNIRLQFALLMRFLFLVVCSRSAIE